MPSAVAAYRIAETSGSVLTDGTSNNYDLNIVVVEGDPSFTTGLHGNGVLFSRVDPFGTPGAGCFHQILEPDPLYQSISGSQQVLIEAVAEIPDLGAGANMGPGPVLGIYRDDGENDPASLWFWDRRMIVDFTGQAGFEGGGYTAFTFDYVNAPFTPGTVTPGVHVMHAVIDTREELAADRMRLYLDGIRVPQSGTTGEGPGPQIITQYDSVLIPLAGTGLPRAGDHYLCLGGIPNYGFGLTGNWRGAIYWARLANVVPSDVVIAERAALLADDWNLLETYYAEDALNANQFACLLSLV